MNTPQKLINCCKFLFANDSLQTKQHEFLVQLQIHLLLKGKTTVVVSKEINTNWKKISKKTTTKYLLKFFDSFVSYSKELHLRRVSLTI